MHVYNQTRIRIREGFVQLGVRSPLTENGRSATKDYRLRLHLLYSHLISVSISFPYCEDQSYLFLFSLWTGSSWKGLNAAGRAEKELGESEVAEGRGGGGHLPSSLFYPLSFRFLSTPPPLPPSSTREPAQSFFLSEAKCIHDQTINSHLWVA